MPTPEESESGQPAPFAVPDQFLKLVASQTSATSKRKKENPWKTKAVDAKRIMGAIRAILGRPATEKELCHPVRLTVGILPPLIRTRPQHNTDLSENTFAVKSTTNKIKKEKRNRA